MNDLIVQLVLLQVVLPLIVITVNAIVPAASLTGLALRTTGISVLLQYSAMAGIWLFPPWWTPRLLMGLHVLLGGVSKPCWREGLKRAAA